MIRHGEAPYLECSSRGDKRFSAFFAYVRGKCIEQWYQEAKVFDCAVSNLTWKELRGLRAENMEECHKLYAALWDEYIEANPHLLRELLQWPGMSDMFGQPGHACQATELWRIAETVRDNALKARV